VPMDHAVPLRTEKLGPPDPCCAVILTWSVVMLLLSTFEDCVTLPGAGWAPAAWAIFAAVLAAATEFVTA
ncbi:MAG: hypothetical protein OXU19_15850, partial [bacterium]|nr:hypothetical protein [bacterium]